MFDFSINTKFFSIELHDQAFYLRIMRRELTWIHPDRGYGSRFFGFDIS
jgi:hypothetical protein